MPTHLSQRGGRARCPTVRRHYSEHWTEPDAQRVAPALFVGCYVGGRKGGLRSSLWWWRSRVACSVGRDGRRYDAELHGGARARHSWPQQQPRSPRQSAQTVEDGGRGGERENGRMVVGLQRTLRGRVPRPPSRRHTRAPQSSYGVARRKAPLRGG
jgi:hypothetical protein